MDFKIIFSEHSAELPDGAVAGRVGEHNATILDILLPADFSFNADFYTVYFNGDASYPVTDIPNVEGAVFTEYGSIIFPLSAAYTQHPGLTVSVAAYSKQGDEVRFLRCTPTVALKLTESPLTDLAKPAGLAIAVHECLVLKHGHDNKNVLDKLADQSGSLTYNGRPIGGDAERLAELEAKVQQNTTAITAQGQTVSAVGQRTTAIEALVPSAASSTNQLSDKAYVDTSVATNTAWFRGTFNSLEELQAYEGEVTNNDYAYVVVRDPLDESLIKEYTRYKYNGSTEVWMYEYSIQLHDLTQEQIDALNSGISADRLNGIVAQVAELVKNTTFSDFQLLEVGKLYDHLIPNPDQYSVPVYIASDAEFHLAMYFVGSDCATVDYEPVSNTLDFGCTIPGEIENVTITGFSFNDTMLTPSDPMYRYALELFSQLYNVDEVSMELQYHEDGLRVPTGGALIAGNSYYLPVHEGASISLTAYKAEKGYAANDQIELYVHVLGEGDVYFDNVVGSYGGAVPELTEGFHKIILTYFPNYGWCIGSTKMEGLDAS